MSFKNDEPHALTFIISLCITAAKDVAKHCLPAVSLKSVHVVLVGSRIFFDIISHSQQQCKILNAA